MGAELQRVLPTPGTIDASTVVENLRRAQHQLAPFHDEVVALCAELARRLRRHPDVRRQPALGALAWWIRPAGVERLRRHWEAISAVEGTIRVPRGVVFHVPPTNVDTMFVYSWLLAALAGNANVVRLSPAAVEATGPLLDTLADVVSGYPSVAATTAVVSYGHDHAVSAALSQGDVRVLWGGDATIAALRAVPLAPHATELAFADRFSFAVLDAAAVLASDDATIGALADGFVNDAYWFDQLGCASPRLVVWVGDEQVTSTAAGRFGGALRARVAQRDERVPVSAVLAKLVHAASIAADGHLTSVEWQDNDVTVADLDDLRNTPRDGPGGGLFYRARIDRVDDLVTHVTRRDQTLTTFGIAGSDLQRLARLLGARGVDRIVPVGQALTFGNHWDGLDLLHAFSRSRVVEVGP